MIIKRNIESELLRWKNAENRKPVKLRGARQVGKTFFLYSMPYYLLPRLDETINQFVTRSS